MWKILRQANQKCLAPKDYPQKLISSGVLIHVPKPAMGYVNELTCWSINN